MSDAAEPLSYHGFTVENILVNPQFQNLDRDLDVIEIFAGVASVHRAAEKAGCASAAFDILRVPGKSDCTGEESEDFSCKQGFVNAIKLVMRLKQNGLCFLAPRCGPWMWLNVVKTKRKKANKYFGDPSYCQEANETAIGAIILMQVAEKREAEIALENPVKSYIFHWPPFTEAMTEMNMISAVTHRCAWENKKKLKPKIWKKYRFIASGDWIKAVERPCPCGDRHHLRTNKTTVENGVKKITGIASRLKESASYPATLGRAIFQAWQKGKTQKLKAEKKNVKSASSTKKAKKVCSAKKTKKSKLKHKKPKKSKANRLAAVSSKMRSQKSKKTKKKAVETKLEKKAAETKVEKKAVDKAAPSWLDPSFSMGGCGVKAPLPQKREKVSKEPVVSQASPCWLNPGTSSSSSSKEPVVSQASPCWLNPGL